MRCGQAILGVLGACLIGIVAGCQTPKFRSSQSLLDSGDRLQLRGSIDRGSYTLVDAVLEYRVITDPSERVIADGYLMSPRQHLAALFSVPGPNGQLSPIQGIDFTFPNGERPSLIYYQWTVRYRLPSGTDLADVSSVILQASWERANARPADRRHEGEGDIVAPNQ